MKIKFCLVVIWLFTGCISEVKVPQDVLTQEEMVGLLIDIHILESQTGQLRISKDSARIVFKHFEDEILGDHKVDSTLYVKSLEFYYSNPKLMEEIYAAVLDSLSLYERMSQGNTEEEEGEQQNK